VRTLRADCLDRILILGRRHLEYVLDVYRCHYNERRPHPALHLRPPNGRDPTPLNATARLRRRDLLGELIHEYDAAGVCEPYGLYFSPSPTFSGVVISPFSLEPPGPSHSRYTGFSFLSKSMQCA
jgi:hypothetical protein